MASTMSRGKVAGVGGRETNSSNPRYLADRREQFGKTHLAGGVAVGIYIWPNSWMSV